MPQFLEQLTYNTNTTITNNNKVILELNIQVLLFTNKLFIRYINLQKSIKIKVLLTLGTV